MVLRALNDIWTALRKFDDQALVFAGYAVLVYSIFLLIKNIIHKIQRKKCDKLWQMVISICLFGVLCIYLSYLVALTLSGRDPGKLYGRINLQIFGTFRANGDISAHAAENILLFIPFGILIPFKTRFFKKWWNLVLIAIISSMLIEISQLITGRGAFEVDDILLNTLGAFIGYIVFSLIYHSYIAFKKESQIPLGRHEQQINRVTLFLIQLLPIILILMMIFRFSSDEGELSGELSMFTTEKLLYTVNKLFSLGMTKEKILNSVADFEGIVRKLAHMTEYAMLTFFTFVFLYCRRIRNNLAFIFTFMFTFIIACLDEINQRSVAGRYSSITDVGIDCAASFIVLMLILILLALIRYFNGSRRLKNVFRRLIS